MSIRAFTSRVSWISYVVFVLNVLRKSKQRDSISIENQNAQKSDPIESEKNTFLKPDDPKPMIEMKDPQNVKSSQSKDVLVNVF